MVKLTKQPRQKLADKLAEPEDLFVLDALTGNNASFLSGRREIITEIANYLSGSSSSCVILGERGVGKTTIAWQVASILDGTNPYFERNQVLKIGKKYSIDFVFHKCKSNVSSVSDLLFNVVTDKSLNHSFASRYKEFFSKDRINRLSHKFEINLFSVLGYELSADEEISRYPSNSNEISSLKSPEQLKREIFEYFVKEAVINSKVSTHEEKKLSNIQETGIQRKLVVFIDELDRVKIPGLGEYIKDNNLVQFVFIGIARNITDILSDHKSAGRKLNGIFKVSLLPEEEIAWIYENAEELSKGDFQFSQEFKSEAINYSGGMPWIAQHVGYNSIFQVRLISEGRVNVPVVLDQENFREGINKTIRVYEEEIGVSLDFSKIDSTQLTGKKVLEAIWEKTDGATVDEIKVSINNPNMNRFVERVLGELIGASILRKIENKYYYYDPVIRIFVKLHLDKDGI